MQWSTTERFLTTIMLCSLRIRTTRIHCSVRTLSDRLLVARLLARVPSRKPTLFRTSPNKTALNQGSIEHASGALVPYPLHGRVPLPWTPPWGICAATHTMEIWDGFLNGVQSIIKVNPNWFPSKEHWTNSNTWTSSNNIRCHLLGRHSWTSVLLLKTPPCSGWHCWSDAWWQTYSPNDNPGSYMR